MDQKEERTKKKFFFFKGKERETCISRKRKKSPWKKIRVFYKMRIDYLCDCKTELKSRNFLGGNGGGGHQSPNKFKIKN
ncbi:unnamed protein product [Arabidopsis lyrata]|uniref:Predicted protein n=1 Tax=Arabidopsis lyrata subsp. lyrata TaxID=81972 RepID=D7M3S7_ARALL|nr:predicted protein [Arabidopsis lyrata subsp. lyrata]CAH8272156.1 unnamed protein product [Arabidopsis lyrata]